MNFIAFRERPQHDCSCCKNFIRNIGNVVSINASGTIKTVWDIKVGGSFNRMMKVVF